MRRNWPTSVTYVHTEHRLVADSLEADWNRKLYALQEAQQQYDRESVRDRLALDEELRNRFHMLATDFPRLWRDPNTPDRERKRLARHLLEDVPLIKRDPILVLIRFPGVTTRTLELPGHFRRIARRLKCRRLLDSG